MRVQRAINNNVVSCVDAQGREVIAMGRGLGFHARPGTELEPQAAEKIFRMETQSQTDRFKDLLASLPPEEIELCTRIIAYATETLNRRLNPSVYLTLTDHISFAMRRMQQGMAFHNALLTEVRVFYPQEFGVGRHALELIQKERNIRFPEDEAASIALHLVNAEYETSLSDTMHITQAMQDILDLVDACQELPLRKGTLCYDELVVHLKFFVMHIFAQEPQEEQEPALIRMVSENYAAEYRCAQKAAACLTQKYGRAVSAEKTADLALYFHRACRRGAGAAEEKRG